MRAVILLIGTFVVLLVEAQAVETVLEEESRELASIAVRPKNRGQTFSEEETLRVQKESPSPYSTENIQKIQEQVFRGESDKGGRRYGRD